MDGLRSERRLLRSISLARVGKAAKRALRRFTASRHGLRAAEDVKDAFGAAERLVLDIRSHTRHAEAPSIGASYRSSVSELLRQNALLEPRAWIK
jgi:hypothetical protein